MVEPLGFECLILYTFNIFFRASSSQYEDLGERRQTSDPYGHIQLALSQDTGT